MQSALAEPSALPARPEPPFSDAVICGDCKRFSPDLFAAGREVFRVLNIVNGKIAGMALTLLLALFSPEAAALMMGEKARSAQKAALEIALREYARGGTHAAIWRKTGWHCPTRQRGSCRWELPRKCHKREMMNLVALSHTSFTGEVALWRVFNAACVWLEYPQVRERVRVHRGDCRGYYGWAAHNGRVCINIDRILRDGPEGEREAHRVLLHELQHQIQYIEGWPKPRHDCPYHLRGIEAEAFEVMRRAKLDDSVRKATPPKWADASKCY